MADEIRRGAAIWPAYSFKGSGMLNKACLRVLCPIIGTLPPARPHKGLINMVFILGVDYSIRYD